ncbi:hypothetical protein [Streptomyces sp. NPDC048419]|uniref:hypothetical protein n=1 Tax=Streptomyces sp. NPDC048419 TaxID=3365547 RepID=UPI00371FD6A4
MEWSRFARQLVQGCGASGILVPHDSTGQTLAPTDQLVIDSDKLQKRLGPGPCLDAARTHQGDHPLREHRSPS